MSEDFAFAAAVAEWALLLRDSKHKGSASYESVLKWASATTTFDPKGHRTEFIELVRRARALSGREQ
jgi:Ca-activated chloride channel family protein